MAVPEMNGIGFWHKPDFGAKQFQESAHSPGKQEGRQRTGTFPNEPNKPWEKAEAANSVAGSRTPPAHCNEREKQKIIHTLALKVRSGNRKLTYEHKERVNISLEDAN